MSIRIEAGTICLFGCHLREEKICVFVPMIHDEAETGSPRIDKKWPRQVWIQTQQTFLSKCDLCPVGDQAREVILATEPEFVE